TTRRATPVSCSTTFFGERTTLARRSYGESTRRSDRIIIRSCRFLLHHFRSQQLFPVSCPNRARDNHRPILETFSQVVAEIELVAVEPPFDVPAIELHQLADDRQILIVADGTHQRRRDD